MKKSCRIVFYFSICMMICGGQCSEIGGFYPKLKYYESNLSLISEFITALIVVLVGCFLKRKNIRM